jgi:hypothetical protein
MLDQEAFARVIAGGQHQVPIQSQPPLVDQHQPQKDAEEEEEDYDNEVVEDVTYHPSGVLLPDGDPVSKLRMDCLPILDILVRRIPK